MKKAIFFLALTWIACGCGGKKNNPVPPPDHAVLAAPIQNAVCVNGAIISDSQSSVTLSWSAAANTDSYLVYVKNLLTSSSVSQTTTATSISITLSRNTPYSWYVVSRSSRTNATAKSDTWKFYNSGPGVVTYPPYPAEITSPGFGQDVTATSGTVNLAWQGSSVTAGTILNYDVYFGNTASPPLFKATVTDSFLDGVAVTSGGTYYWKIITRDNTGNTSDSGLYEFSVR
ncbi:MAG: hypothetical protein JST32_16185 [Bacteroidetes bacterium]|nr:hypothetical protein [Bacteroidota bacterium]